jgi:translation initiation factor IF-3
MRLAEENDIDLVEIAPTAKPPVCRLMDYGKFKYRESKKAHEAKLKQKQIQVKEVKFRPGTDEGDYKIKVRNLTASSPKATRRRSRCVSAAARWRTRSSACSS